MEQDIGFLAVDGDIGGATLDDRVRRSSDILVVGILRVGLVRGGLDGGLFAQVSVRDGQLRILDSFHEIGVDIFDLHLFLGGRISDRSQRALFARLGLLMWMGFTSTKGILFFLLREFGIPISLVLV